MPLIYQIKCSVCGEELSLERTHLDSDNDLTIDVTPCEGCMGKAMEGVASQLEEAVGEITQLQKDLENLATGDD